MLDTIFPFFVGHRTEITAVLVALVNLAASAGLVSKDISSQVNGVLIPMILGFFAAKASRPAPVAVSTSVSGAPVKG